MTLKGVKKGRDPLLVSGLPKCPSYRGLRWERYDCKSKIQIAVINCELSCFDINLTFHMLFNIHLNSQSHFQDPL